jgi:hypothetical protein
MAPSPLVQPRYVIEPLVVVAEPHHAPASGRTDVSAAEPALPHQPREIGADLALNASQQPNRHHPLDIEQQLPHARARHQPHGRTSILNTSRPASLDTAPLLHRCRSVRVAVAAALWFGTRFGARLTEQEGHRPGTLLSGRRTALGNHVADEFARTILTACRIRSVLLAMSWCTGPRLLGSSL